MPRQEVAFMVGELFGDEGGRAIAQRIDARVDALPGLEGLHLVELAIDRYKAGVASASAPTPVRPARLAA